MGIGTAELQFDDLTEPRLTDVQRQILDHTERRRVDLDIERMVEEAVAEAGVDDFADTDGFWDRVSAYVGAIEADIRLTQLLRGTLRQRLVRLLRNRLYMCASTSVYALYVNTQGAMTP